MSTLLGSSPSYASADTSLENYFFGNSGRLAATGGNSTSVGSAALISATTGGGETAIGRNAAQLTTTGYSNTAVGYNALTNNTTGSENTAIGAASLTSNTTADWNVAIGVQALQHNTTGTVNFGAGVNAARDNTTGNDNIAIGYASLLTNTVGRRNIALGTTTLGDLIITTATGENTAIGYNTGRGIITGTQNTIIGANVTGLSSALSNNVIIADGAGTQRISIDNNGKTSVTGVLVPLAGISSSTSTSSRKLNMDDNGNTAARIWLSESSGNHCFLTMGSGNDAPGSGDISLMRNAAGIFEINSSTFGTYRDLKARYYYTSVTNDSSIAGTIGEYVSASVVQGSAAALTTATPKTITSISLTAGDWDVTAIGALTGASTGTEFDVAIGTTTNSLTGTVLGDSRCQTPTVSLTGADASLMIPAFRVSISSTTTYYLIVQETFTVGTPAAYGRISARRVR